MTKEQRNKYLEELARSNTGIALKEYFQELIEKLTDGRNYSKDDFEIEGKTSIKAAAVLEKIMRDLELLKKPKKEIKKNQYI